MYSGVQMNSEITRALYGFMAIILLIIVFASVFMIYDSFAVSYQQRARYLGMLASVGATRVQKRGSVYFEGFILGCIGIPIGILCGIGGIAVTLRALSDSFMKPLWWPRRQCAAARHCELEDFSWQRAHQRPNHLYLCLDPGAPRPR